MTWLTFTCSKRNTTNQVRSFDPVIVEIYKLNSLPPLFSLHMDLSLFLDYVIIRNNNKTISASVASK